MRPLFEPFDELERIARNKPSKSISKEYPRVTDGTTSSIVQKTPRRIIQQLPTGHLKTDDEGPLGVLADFIYSDIIIPNANQQFALIQKAWNLTKMGLTFGAAHSYTPLVQRGDYFGPDMQIPYIKDVFFEAGKISNQDSNCVFMRSWYQPKDIEAIIYKEKKLKQQADELKEQYSSGWDLKALEAIKKDITTKADEDTSQQDRKQKDDSHKGGIEIIHAFQRGVGGTFFSIHPKSQTIVRTRVNKDPRGEIPIQTFYSDTDGINPLGYGIVEQVASLQNLIDSEMQMYQFNRALMLAPPMVKRGNYNKSQIQLMPNKIIDLGSDPNAQLDTLKVDNSAIGAFANNYGLMKSQLLNLTSSPDTSVSATIGNPGFSKTPAGVRNQQAIVGVDDNYFRKQFESWFEQWSECAVNLYFAEREGIEQIQLDKKTAERIRKLDESIIDDKNVVTVDFSDAKEELKFEVDASTSHMKDDESQLQALDGLLERYERSQALQQIVPPESIIHTWNSIVTSSAVENQENLVIDVEEWKAEQEEMAAQQAQQQQMQQQQMQEQQMQQQMQQQAMQEQMQQESMQPQRLPDDEETQMVIQELAAMGLSEEKIGQALALLQSGMSIEEVLELVRQEEVVNV